MQVISKSDALKSTGVSLSKVDRLIAQGTLKRYNESGQHKPKNERGPVFLSVAEVQQHLGLKHTPDTSPEYAPTRHDVSLNEPMTHHDTSPSASVTHPDTSPIRADTSGKDDVIALLRDQLNKAEARADTLQRHLEDARREAAAEREKFLAVVQDQTSTVRLLTDQRQPAEPEPEPVTFPAPRSGFFGKLRHFTGF